MVRSLNGSIASMRAINAFKGASRLASSQLAKLSSGSRIPNAKEDAASLSVSKGISLEIQALKSARSNLLQGSSMMQMAEGALGTMADTLNRMEVISTLARNSTNSPQELQALDLEYQQLVGALDSVVSGTEFNGRSLLGERPEFRMGIIDADVDSDDGFAGYNVEPNFPLHQDGDFFEISYDHNSRLMTMHHVRTDRYQTVELPNIDAGTIENIRFSEMGMTVKLNGDFNDTVSFDPTTHNTDISIAANTVGVTTFVPSDIANLVMHVSAAASPLTLTGNGVQNAGDLAPVLGGNNAFIQNLGSSQPDIDNGAVFGRDAFDFDGTENFILSDNAEININAHQQKSVAMSFATGGNVAARQLLWEEGSTVNGLNVYIDGGNLYFGVYRSSGANGTWLSTPIAPNSQYSMSATYDNITNTTALYLNGVQVAAGAGINGVLPAHSGDIGVGRLNDNTIYHDGPSAPDTDYFTGQIAEIVYYNNALTPADHVNLDAYLTSSAFTEILFNSDEINIQAASGADMVDRIALDIPQMAKVVYDLSQTNIQSSSAANAAHTAIGVAMDAINAARADVGSFMNRLAFAEGLVSVSIENQTQAESTLADADISREMTSFMSQSLILETASEMILKGQENGQQVLALLDGSLGQ
ncbi:MAG: flagellin [Pseudomonadota bacterium]|nr:flagellin [Pseudomonadota bacterium]